MKMKAGNWKYYDTGLTRYCNIENLDNLDNLGNLGNLGNLDNKLIPFRRYGIKHFFCIRTALEQFYLI